MARKLKTYQTSVGYFDLAIAAPSMKAAAEAWGSQTDVFRRGFAKETQDPAIVAATMAKTRRRSQTSSGINEPFSEHAALPRLPNIDSAKESPTPRYKRNELPTRKTDDKAAALAFEKERKRREAARRKEEASSRERRKQRADAIAKAEGAFSTPSGSTKGKSKTLNRIELPSMNGPKRRALGGRSKSGNWSPLCVGLVTRQRRRLLTASSMNPEPGGNAMGNDAERDRSILFPREITRELEAMSVRVKVARCGSSRRDWIDVARWYQNSGRNQRYG